jgi:hypothetical protein
MTTEWSWIARAISSRRALTGSDSGYVIDGIALAPRAGIGAAWGRGGGTVTGRG